MNCQIASQAVKNLALEVVGHVEVCHDLETLKTVKKHLSSALLVLKVDKEKRKLSRLDPKSNTAPNANREKQPRFFSTKQKRQSKARLPKPSHEDEESTWNKLVTTEVTVCDYCWQEEDDGHDPDVSWISCSNCGVWIHSSCVHCNSSSTLDDFWCKRCF